MADVFISYSRLDHDRVRPIVERLGSLGYSVWWDKHLRAGQVFVDEIERELNAAKAVLTAWSRSARSSTWVYAESSRGLDQGKFLQLRLDDAQPPLPFNALQLTELTSRRSEWGALEDSLSRMVSGASTERSAHARAPSVQAASPAPLGAPRLLATASGLTLAAYAGAVSAAYNGAISPEQLQVALWGMVGVGGVCALASLERLVAVWRTGG